MGMLRRHWGDPLYRNSYYLILSSWSQLALGGLFWLLAARHHAAADIGWGATAVSALSLVAYVGTLGLGWGFLRFIPPASPPVRRRIVGRAMLVSAGTTLGVACAALVCFALLPGTRPLPVLATSWMFVVFGVAAAAQLLVENAFTSLRSASLSLAAALTVGLGRIGALVLLDDPTPRGFLIAWGLPPTVVVLAATPWLARRLRGIGPSTREPGVGELLRYSLTSHTGFLVLLASTLAMPGLITLQLGPDATALYYVAFAIATVVFGIPNAAARSLFAEGSRERVRFADALRRALRYAGLLALAGVLGVLAFSPLLLSMFGATYSGAQVALWMLVASTPLVLLRSMTEAFLSVTDRVRDLAVVSAGTGLLYLGLSAPLGLVGPWGIGGIALAWGVANAFAVVYALLRYGFAWQRIARREPLEPALPVSAGWE